MRRRAIALLLLPAAVALLAPRPALAACGVQDPAGCVDGALHTFWYGLAGMGWALDRTLLLLAYQLDTFRWWLVEVAFTSAYQALVQIIDPLIVPFATLAVTVGGLSLLLVPLFGRPGLVNVRHALVWTVLAPLLLTVSGPLIVQLEQVRSGVGAALFDGVSQIAPGAIFGASGSDMNTPAPLYPSNPCGTPLTRRSGAGLRADDLAAALLWADAEDIHCPDAGGPSADVPDLFFDAAPSGAGYARDENVAEMNAGNVRAQAVQSMQRGAVRTFLGLLPATLAVLDTLVQLVFALCLIALWISLPIGLLFVFFTDTASAVTGLGRRMLGVLQVSWSSSVLLGLLTACLIAAGELRNAAAYTGFSLAGIALTGYVLVVAVETLKLSLRTVSDTVTTVTGLAPSDATALAGDLARAAGGAGAATAAAGVGTGATALAAMQQVGSARYATAAALGRIRPLAQLGEVASAMGWMDDEEVARGLYAGERSAHGSWRGTRLQMLADAKHRDAEGLTFAERAEERGVARELRRAERPTVVEELASVARAGRAVYDYVGSAEMATDMYQAGEWLPDRTRAGWERVRETWRGVDTALGDRAGARPLARGAAAVQLLDEGLRPGGAGTTVALDERRRVVYGRTPETLPETALSAPRDEVNPARLLVLGYTVLDRGDGALTFWKAQPSADDLPRAQRGEPADERRRLVQAGALLGAAATGRAVEPPSSPDAPAAAPSAIQSTARQPEAADSAPTREPGEADAEDTPMHEAPADVTHDHEPHAAADAEGAPSETNTTPAETNTTPAEDAHA